MVAPSAARPRRCCHLRGDHRQLRLLGSPPPCLALAPWVTQWRHVWCCANAGHMQIVCCERCGHDVLHRFDSSLFILTPWTADRSEHLDTLEHFGLLQLRHTPPPSLSASTDKCIPDLRHSTQSTQPHDQLQPAPPNRLTSLPEQVPPTWSWSRRNPFLQYKEARSTRLNLLVATR